MPENPIQEMLQRFQALMKQTEKDEMAIGLLMEYIEFFHAEMTKVSNAVADKTEELFAQLLELTGE